MPTILPPSTDYTGASVTQGGKKTFMTAMRQVIAELIGTDSAVAPGLRNRLLNGNFQVNQRNVSGTVTLAAGAYGHDRWKAGASGCTYTFAASGNDTIVTITAGSLMQIVEDIHIEGGQYRLSHAGTAQARIGVNGAAPSGSYATTPLTSATATAKQTITVEFSTGTVHRAKLEPGTQETTFERVPYPMMLAMCQRYLPAFTSLSSNEPVCSAQAVSGTQAQCLFPFVVEPRVPPTGVTALSGFYLTVATGGTSGSVASLTFTLASRKAALLTATTASSVLTAGHASTLLANTTTSQLLFTGCEL